MVINGHDAVIVSCAFTPSEVNGPALEAALCLLEFLMILWKDYRFRF